MLEIKVTGGTPLEALSTLTALGMHCMQNADVCEAARRILEAEKRPAAAQAAPVGVVPPPQTAPERETVPDAPMSAPAPTEAPGPADGASGPTAAPGEAPGPVPTMEQVRAKGIEASRRCGKKAVVDILQMFNVSGMSDLAEKDRAAFLARLEGLGEENA